MSYFILAVIVVAIIILVNKFGPPIFSLNRRQKFHNAELVKTLLSLEEESLEKLFKLYKAEFGEGAAGYARRTYKKWKAGEVRPNRQTFNRFLVYLPKVMSYD